MKIFNPSSLKIKSPFGRTFLLAIIFLLVIILVGENRARSIPEREISGLTSSYGITSSVLDVKLIELKRVAAQRGGIDVIFLGSSMVNNGIDTVTFESEMLALTGQLVRAYNLGGPAIGVADARWMARYLYNEYSPKLIVYGTTVRDFALPGLSRSFADNPWIHYQQSYISLDGWLRDSFLSYQNMLVYRNWMRPDFHDLTVNRETVHRRMQPLGFMSNRIANPEEVSRSPSHDNESDILFFEENENNLFNFDRLQILKDLLGIQDDRLGIVLLEMPVFPTFVEFY
ncbi:MAG: hypothetical protein IH898_07045, partial [Planctomycetes bacterium]|nr:hypothetical protein [Planctomycetota bacterium]